jgi:hypothetical protein
MAFPGVDDPLAAELTADGAPSYSTNQSIYYL